MHIADVNALGARLGWLPSFPSFDRTRSSSSRRRNGPAASPAEHVVDELRRGGCGSPARIPTRRENHPELLTVWRANVLGSSGKGHEYFLKHLLGTTDSAVRAEETPPELRPRDVVWRDEAPGASSTCSTTIDFRMTSNALFSDVVLPAATWYEKYDLSSTDLHPFVHTFNEAVAAAVGEQDRLGRLQAIAPPLLRAGRDAPRRAPGCGRRAAAARHPR